MELGIAGRVALVAASSKGLGRASAAALAAEGARLVICGRGEEALRSAEAELRDNGAEVHAVVGDVTAPDAPAALVAEALSHFGDLDIVVANAGGPPPGHALDVGPEQLQGALETSLLSSVRLVQAAVPHLQAKGWGRICCISSYSIVQAIPGLALSNMARSGLRAWAKTAAHDLAGSGVTLNLACPGVHATERAVALGIAGRENVGDPADFGKVVAFLCSDPARYVSGATVVVDGGDSLAL
jgi:3-oxoacyl-[acyl-carrier protein] reductase